VTVVAQTRALLAAVVAVAITDAAVHTWRWWSAPVPIPALASFDPDEAVRITVERTDGSLTLERGAEGWTLVEPVRAPADAAEVDALLDAVSGGMRPDARLVDPDQETYGLAGGEEISLDIEGASAVLLDLVVGKDAGGGSTWIRRAGDDAVLRAAIGGRARFERPAGAWRDRTVTSLDPAAVRGVRLRWEGTEVTSTRTALGWSGNVDGPTVDRAVALASHLRAAEVAADDRAPTPAIVLELDADPPLGLELGRSGDVWTVRRTDGPTVWRIDPTLPDLIGDPAHLVPREVWREDPAAVSGFVFEREGAVAEIVREGTGFRRVRPAGVDLDVQRIAALVAFLAAPRVEGWLPAAVGPARRTWRVRFGDRVRVLELGADADQVWIREASAPDRVGFLPLRTVRTIEGIVGL
jgi:hypothetical protein